LNILTKNGGFSLSSLFSSTSYYPLRSGKSSRDGSIQDGSIQDGAVHDGAIQQKAAQQEAVQKGSILERSNSKKSSSGKSNSGSAFHEGTYECEEVHSPAGNAGLVTHSCNQRVRSVFK
jgi:hypothetical protein